MLHLAAIIAGTGVHYLVILRASTWPTREHRSFADVELAAEVRICELVDGEERNEANVEHGLAELLFTVSHLMGG